MPGGLGQYASMGRSFPTYFMPRLDTFEADPHVLVTPGKSWLSYDTG